MLRFNNSATPAEAVKSRTKAIKAMEVVLQQITGLDDLAVHAHLADTPRRFVDALIGMSEGASWNFTTFDVPETHDNGLVVVRDIPVTSLCAHHLFPWFGVAHVAYIPRPGGKLAGLSKLARTVYEAALGFTVQEEVGAAAVDTLVRELDPLGAAVIIKASHTCMESRGAKAHGSTTATSSLRGVFFDDPRARAELLSMISL